MCVGTWVVRGDCLAWLCNRTEGWEVQSYTGSAFTSHRRSRVLCGCGCRMRGVVAFVIWLFGLWTWFQAFFRLRWFKTAPVEHTRPETSDPGEKRLPSSKGQHVSPLATFLGSLPDDGSNGLHHVFDENGFRLGNHGLDWSPYVTVRDIARAFTGDEATYREFLAAVASSEAVCPGRRFCIHLKGDESLKHLEEIVVALLSNNNIKRVNVSCSNCSALQMAEQVSKLLLGNRVIQDLCLQLDSQQVLGKEAGEQLAIALNENRVLQRLSLSNTDVDDGGGVDDEGLEALVAPLKSPGSVLQDLLIDEMSDVGLEHVGVMLSTNTSLKLFRCSDVGSGRDNEVCMRGYGALRDALCNNRSLQTLQCMIRSSMELKMLLEPLMAVNNNRQANTTLTSLRLDGSRIGGKEGVDILVDMIRSNTSVLELYLNGMFELCQDDVESASAILEALKANKSLKRIGFEDCDGVGGYRVLGTMMDLLLENHHLRDIALCGTPLKRSGDAEYVYSELKKRKKMKLWDLIQGMANTSPTSGRVFLCGNPYAGKTTLRKSMKKLPEFQNKGGSQDKKSSKVWLSFQGKRLHDKIQRGFKEPKISKAKVTNERTRGIEIDTVYCNGIGISIWDMAGQSDYHSFHDLVVPNLSADGSCSLFLVMCNPMVRGSAFQRRNISAIKSEIEYWLRFIASNTRRSWLYRPHVLIVMTHFDYWNDEKEFEACIEDKIEELKSEFQEVLKFDLGKTMFKVDGEEVLCARKVFDSIKIYLKQLMEALPKTIKACVEVQNRIAIWNEEIAKQSHEMQALMLPVLKWGDFSNKMFEGVKDVEDVDEEVVEKKKEFVAISLNDGGHIMYYEVGGFVITNPHWFCHDIMGEFLHNCANVDAELEMVTKHGMISLDHVKRMLSKVIGSQGYDIILEDLLSMMKKLHICYQQDTNFIMIPSTLKDKCQQLIWPTNDRLTSNKYIGRRLSCKDEKRTMLTLGFFPRLQVSFFKKFQSNNIGNSYQIFEGVIMFVSDGIEVIIESNHIYIDILLRSEQCQDKMLDFLQHGIVLHITKLLASPTLGCAGVILVEHILRPRCVQELVDFKDRKDQFASMDELELEVITSGPDASHNWKPCGNLGTSHDKVKTLLGNKAWKRLLQRRCEDLKRYEREIFHITTQQNLARHKAKDSSWTSLILQILHKLLTLIARDRPNVLLGEMKKIDDKLDTINRNINVVTQKIDYVMQMQESIVDMQDDLIQKVSSSIDTLMAFSIRMQQSQVPKLAYLTDIGRRKLLMRLVPGVTEFQLHLMCESRDGIHIVANQQGCKVTFGTNDTKTFVNILVWGLKIATILTKIGAHVAGGMGGMVPNFSDGLQLGGLVLDTPGLLDQISFASLEALPNGVKRRPTITIDDESKAQEWLIGYLEPKCKEQSTFYGMFGLKKVWYKGVSGNQSIAWICEKCKSNAIQNGKLF